MSKESRKHKLEDFFRNSLQGLQAEPSGDLWDRIDAGIPPKPRRRRKWLVWFFFGGLLGLLGTAWWLQMNSYESQIAQMETSLEEQKEHLSRMEAQIANFQGLLEKPEWEEPLIDETSEEKLIASERSPNTSSFSSNKKIKPFSIGKASKQMIWQNENPKPLRFEDNLITSTLIADRRDESLSLFSSSKSIKDGITPKIPAKTIELLAKADKELRPKRIQLNKAAVNSSPRVEFYTGIYQTYPTLDGKSQSLDWQFSRDIGVNLVFDLSRKFQLGIGLGYTELVVDGQLQEELIYWEDDPNNSDFGLIHSHYTYELLTRYGRLGISSVLANQKLGDGNDLEHGDIFQLDFEIRDQIRYVNIPMTLRYGIGQGRYKLRFHAGFIQRIFYNARTRLREVSTDFGRLQNDHTEVQKELGDIALTSFDFTGGIGAEYHLTPYTSLHFNTVYMQSMKEIYRHTKPYSFGIQLGIQTQLSKKR